MWTHRTKFVVGKLNLIRVWPHRRVVKTLAYHAAARVHFPDGALVGLAARAAYVHPVSFFPHVSLLCVPLLPLSSVSIKGETPKK